MSEDKSNIIALLGASNLYLTTGPALRQLARFLPGPQEVFIARGAGRSYGIKAGWNVVNYVGLSRSGLFDALARAVKKHPHARVYALLTDVGNDLLYGASPKVLVKWVGESMLRLREMGARVAVTAMPAESIGRGGPARYLFFRSLYYYSCRIPREEMIRRIEEVGERLTAFCSEHEISLLPVDADWYSIDRFHLRWGARTSAWSCWLEHFLGRNGEAISSPRGKAFRLWDRQPQRCWSFGVERKKEQSGWDYSADARLYFY